MQNENIIRSLTLYPSEAWCSFYKDRNIFKCSCEENDSSAQNIFLCHYIQSFGDIKARVIGDKLSRHIIKEAHISSVGKEGGFIRQHDAKLILLTRKVFNEVYNYTSALKNKIETMYSTSLSLDDPDTTFERFVDTYFAKG